MSLELTVAVAQLVSLLAVVQLVSVLAVVAVSGGKLVNFCVRLFRLLLLGRLCFTQFKLFAVGELAGVVAVGELAGDNVFLVL